MKNRQESRYTGLVALVLIFLVAPSIAFHSAWVLIPLAVIVGVFTLLWRLAPSSESRFSTLEAPAVIDLNRRVAALESQLQRMNRDHDQLEEMVRWQERLLQQSVERPATPPRMSTVVPSAGQTGVRSTVRV